MDRNTVVFEKAVEAKTANIRAELGIKSYDPFDQEKIKDVLSKILMLETIEKTQMAWFHECEHRLATSIAGFFVECLMLPLLGLRWANQMKMTDQEIASHFDVSLLAVKSRQLDLIECDAFEEHMNFLYPDRPIGTGDDYHPSMLDPDEED